MDVCAICGSDAVYSGSHFLLRGKERVTKVRVATHALVNHVQFDSGIREPLCYKCTCDQVLLLAEEILRKRTGEAT